jgi:hypothetical protein
MAEYIITYIDDEFKKHEIKMKAKDRLDLMDKLLTIGIEDEMIGCVERLRRWKKSEYKK